MMTSVWCVLRLYDGDIRDVVAAYATKAEAVANAEKRDDEQGLHTYEYEVLLVPFTEKAHERA